MSKPPIYLYDDPADLARFLPFSASRPIGELRYGAHLLRERWERAGFGPIAGQIFANLRLGGPNCSSHGLLGWVASEP